jgi:PAS domain S-box-containing protein
MSLSAPSNAPSSSSVFPTPPQSVPPTLPRAFVQVLLDSEWDIVAVLEADGCTRYVSPSNERLLGYARADLVGTNGFDLVHPDDRPIVDEILERLRRQPGVTETMKHRFRAADGSWRVCACCRVRSKITSIIPTFEAGSFILATLPIATSFMRSWTRHDST